jgi:hypoxanthine phosphoribosyltransferase
LKIVDWDEYTKLLNKLSYDVRLQSFDEIVAIGRGGCIIAAYLASKLGLPTFQPVFVRHVGRGEDLKIIAHDIGGVKSLRGSLLIVDDWLCEGRAMNYVLKLLPKEVSTTTMVMFNRKGSEFKPDYVGTYIEEEERDIMFPYDPIG